MMKSNDYIKCYGTAFLIVLIDQSVKLWVHDSMQPGSGGEISIIGNFFKLHYLTNSGMAFGMRFAGEYGKLLLSLLRFGAIFLIIYFVYYLIKHQYNNLLKYGIACVLGGAMGNMIDSVFYGVLLDNAPVQAPFKWLHGQVIDMFFIDIWTGYLPDAWPFMGGTYVSLWPVFNIADASIFIAVIVLLLFQRNLLTTLRLKADTAQHTAKENNSADIHHENNEENNTE